MITEPLTIDGLAGDVVVTTSSLFGRPVVTVGGAPAVRTGRVYALPALAGGSRDGVVRTTLVDPYPTVVVDGVRHRTGPEVPLYLKVLLVLPLVMIGIGGLVGGLLAAAAVAVNVALVTRPLSSVTKALAMVGVAVLTFVVWLGIVIALRGAAG